MQGAIHTLCAARPTPKAIQEGWRVGFIYCRKQESYSGLSKSKANDLMQEVCADSPISNLLQNLWVRISHKYPHTPNASFLPSDDKSERKRSSFCKTAWKIWTATVTRT